MQRTPIRNKNRAIPIRHVGQPKRAPPICSNSNIRATFRVEFGSGHGDANMAHAATIVKAGAARCDRDWFAR